MRNRVVITEHARYELNYDDWTFSRSRINLDAAVVAAPQNEIGRHPFTRTDIVDGRLHIEDEAAGYWSTSTTIVSDSWDVAEMPA